MQSYFPLHIFHELLLAWYKKHKRDLPWRKIPRNPYHILVSELMLQQTQVSRVLPKFEYFISTWPTVEALSNASLSQVLIAWAGLGYNRRAKHLLETAKIIVHTHNGSFPTEKAELQKLPGFGPYMVSALRVFAFGKQEAVVDVNVLRVLTRVTGEQEIRNTADQFVPAKKADDWHQALMDFGSNVCTAKSPHCTVCPLSRICRANKEAQEKGFLTYAEWLITQPKIRKVSKKDTGKKFEETDRYFRGRVIDYLRQGTQPMTRLQEHILIKHKLNDRKRFGQIIEGLVIDGLVKVHGGEIRLA